MDNKTKFNSQHSAADLDEYKSHTVFKALARYIAFYNSFSFSIMGFASSGTRAIINLDSYVYSSMEGTLESIKLVLEKGRIGDAFALLRKFHDSVTLNNYTNLYLSENTNRDGKFLVDEVISWLNNEKRLPLNTYGSMSEYLESSLKLKRMFEIIYSDKTFKDTRIRCNDHTHYNFFDNVLINDNQVHSKKRIPLLTSLEQDLNNIFILHLACIFTLNDHYMMSSDYVDCLDVGIEPDPESVYWVSPFIKEVLNEIVLKLRPDIYNEIKSNTMMKI